MQDLARLGFLLLGLDLIFSPLAKLGPQLFLSVRSDVDVRVPLLLSFGAWAVFGLAPGLFLLARNRHLASSLFPNAGAEPLEPRSIFAALVALLGVYFIIEGIGRLVVSVISVGLLSHLDPQLWSEFVGGAVSALLFVGLGFFLAIRAAHVARFV